MGASAQDTPAPDLNLKVQRQSTTIGRDGVQRESRYTDRVYRRSGMVWTERDFPAALGASDTHGHEARQQGEHAGHAHSSTVGSPVWVQQAADGKIEVRMVWRQQRKVLAIDEAHYGNVGYGGSWNVAYWLVDPGSLARMEKAGPVSGGVQRYRLRQGESSITVDWDVAAQYARQIESRGPHGLTVSRMTAVSVPAPKVLPWKAIEGYEQGDYSDLLD
ncbi:hypothetical protein EV675_2613 [Pigmentiphaga kullae]|uniref:Outer membrane lipoprotein-sorting protein n=2 Tax=Pigmentiphaga kullae TaxID=151784 RepID=A0A4Q7NNP6_9BURK|nr:hypothetical protein EV675_2613 [Pigmentiphaga kullae]